MKKYFSLLLVAFLSFTVLSCVEDDNNDYNYTDYDTYPVAYDLKNVSFSYDSTDDYYYIYREFNSSLVESDVVLIYRQSGTDSGNPVWQLIPRTIYLDSGDELDYDYDFTKNDFKIWTLSTLDLYSQTTTFKNTYLNNQTFRIVIVPASTGTAKINYSDYNVVAAKYGIEESDVKTLK